MRSTVKAMRVRRSLLIVAALFTGACTVVVEPARTPVTVDGSANEIVARYHRALDNICETGVTSEAVALYHAVDKLWDAQPTGGGRGSNFGGARDPHMAWQACFQSPGFL